MNRLASVNVQADLDEVDKASYAYRDADRRLPGWPTALGASTSATLVAAGVSPLVTGSSHATATAAAIGALATASVTTLAFCSERRREIATNAQAALERVAGPVRRFRVRRWRGGLIGTPVIVRFTYQPAAVIANKTWPSNGAAALATVLGARYSVSRHDPRRGQITLRLRSDTPDENHSVEVERATAMMRQLFGQTSSVQVTAADDALSRITVEHECGVKATFPVWRERVERVVTTMLEGRWRARWDLSRDKVTFELRPTMENFVARPAPDLDPSSRHLIPLGVDEDGNTVMWDLLSSMPHFLVSGKTGKGKACSITTPIATSGGWTPMGALEVGANVFDEAGRPATVTGVYDQPAGRECFEVVFSDGATIVADAEHLWWTEDRAARVAQWPGRPQRERRQRLTAAAIERLQLAAAEAARDATTTIPEAAALAGIDPTSRWLYEIAKSIDGVVHRTRVVDNPYREQTVTQTQTVRVFDGPATIQRLKRAAQRMRRLDPWQTQLQTLEIPDEITVTELSQLTGIPRGLLHGALRGGDLLGRLEKRQVQRQVPARTVRRTFGTVAAYPTKVFLQALAEAGRAIVNDQRHKTSHGRVRTTREIGNTLRTVTGHLNHSIPVTKPLDLPAADLPIPPYTFGAWLGDGSSWEPVITSADPEIIAYIQADGFETTAQNRASDAYKNCRAYTVHGLRRQLRQQCLLKAHRNHGSTKRIPPIYLRSSVAQRRDLLAGLLDTDGTVSPQGTTQFTTVLPGLADDVEELATSLGYRVSRLQGVARLDGRETGPKWTIAFTTADPVFRLQRKLDLLAERTQHHNPAKNKRRYITAVRPVPEVPMRCITVDSPSHLFLAGRAMIPTHNTVVLRGVVMEAAAREIAVWVCDPKRVELIGLRDLPNVRIVATTIEEQIVTILRAWDLMEDRYAAITAGTANDDDFDLVLLVVDEFAEFSRRVSQWWSRVKLRGMPTVCPVMEKFDSLVRLGRTAGIRIAIGIQRPDVRFFGESGESRDNFDSRISLGRLSADGSRMMWGSSIGTSLPGVRGRAIACTSEDNAVEVQTFWVPDPRRIQTEEERGLLQEFWPTKVRHLPLEISIPAPAVDAKGVANVWGSLLEATMEPRTLPLDDVVDEEPEPPNDPADDQTDPAANDDGDVPEQSARIVAFPTGRKPRRASRGTATAPVAPPDPAPAPASADADYGDPLDDYGPPVTLTPDEVVDGQLLELDPDVWAVVESVEQDPDNDQEWMLNWRSIDPGSDEFGAVAVPAESTVRCRGMLDEEADS